MPNQVTTREDDKKFDDLSLKKLSETQRGLILLLKEHYLAGIQMYLAR